MPTLSFETHGHGSPVVLLHAFPLDRQMWAEVTPELAIHHRVILPDLPGFGRTPLDPSASIESMADAVAELCDSLASGVPVVLGGCSMGGYVALAFARRYPHRLKALLLIDTKAEPDDDAAKAARNAMIAKADTLSAEFVAEAMVHRALGGTTHASRPNVVAEYQRIVREQSVAGILAAQVALRDRPDAGPGLAEIRVPTLIVVGSEDVITPPPVARSLSERIAGSRLVELPAAGHLPSLETPGAFTAAVRSFVETLVRA